MAYIFKDLSRKAECDLGYMLYNGISKRIQKAICMKDKSELAELSEMVDWYCKYVIVSCSHLRVELLQLRALGVVEVNVE